jgi:hypothetical protein
MGKQLLNFITCGCESSAPFLEGRVFESAAIGTSVVEAIALDSDKGENAEISYSIQSGSCTVHSKFQYNHSSYVGTDGSMS